MQDFVARVSSCRRCDLATTRTNVVIGSGRLDARLLLIGEAPGRNEDEGGEPFVGRSGQLLMRILEEEVGLRRSDCYITNVVRCRPPGNRTPTKHELAACRPWWDEQMHYVKPALAITLGLTATRAVTGVAGSMRDVHGTIHTAGTMRVLATYHPAAALRGGKAVEALLRADVRKAGTLLSP